MAVDLLKLIRKLRRAKNRRGGGGEGGSGAVAGSGQVVVKEKVEEKEKEAEEEKDEGEGEEEDPFEEVKEVEKIGLYPGKESTSWIEESKGEERKEKEKQDEERDIERKYPLIPQDPSEGEKVFAWAHITYDEEEEELIYRMIEPDLSEENREVLETIEDILKERLDVDFEQLKKEEAKNYMQRKVREILEEKDFGISEEDKDIIEYYAYRNFVGLGKIEPLMNDTEIEDISCDGIDIPVYIYHRDPEIGSVRSDVKFGDEEEMDSFVRKLAQRCGRSISMAEPLLDGALPDGSRVQATLGTDIARRGTNFTIRRFTEEPLTPIHLLEYGTISAEMIAYLWMCVENGKSCLISGATASGKTTMLNSLSLFIRPE
ncbi:MAG: ATPase, T2SS/T4P/T4SS family, partial [Candidatus Nanohaloarchaea archaeon]|nr:ATPase, T2SS/T4P/T4SS family [Candidatus Nanohaloarchaea archaeon]